MKKIFLITIVILFVSVNFSYASVNNQQVDKNQSSEFLKEVQNQVPIFKNVKSKVKTWFNKKQQQIQEVIPFDFNKNQGRGLAIALMAIGFVLLIGSMLPMVVASLGITEIIILLIVSMVGLAIFLAGALHNMKISQGPTN